MSSAYGDVDETSRPWTPFSDLTCRREIMPDSGLTLPSMPGWEELPGVASHSSQDLPCLWQDVGYPVQETSIGTGSPQPAHSAVYSLAKDYSEKRTSMLLANTDLVAIPARLNEFADRSMDVTIDPALLTEPVAIVYESAEQEEKAKNLFTLYRNKYNQYRDRGTTALQSAAMLFAKEPDTSVTDVVCPHANATLPIDASRDAERHQQLSEEILALMLGDRHDPLALAKLNQELFTKSGRFYEQGKGVAERYGWEWDASDPSSTPRGATSTRAFSLD